MDRRRYLWLTAGILTGVAGCGAESATDSTSPSPTPVPVTQNGQPTASPTPADVLTVGIETDDYLIRSFAQTPEQRAIDPDEVTPIAEIAEPLRSALRTAVNGGFTTDSVSDALLGEIDRFRHHGGGYRFRPYFSLDGTPYEFDPTVPVFVARLDTDIEEPDPDRTVDHDDANELAPPVQDFVRTLGAFGVEVATDEYRISVVPEAVEEFLDQYDYIRSPGSVGKVVSKWVDPGPPYTIQAGQLTMEHLWGRPVIAVDSLSATLRQFVETVVASDRRAPVYSPLRSEHRVDQVPNEYDARLGHDQGPGSGPYVDIDGTVYALRVTKLHREKIPIAVAASTVDNRRFSVSVKPSTEGSKPAFEDQVELESPGALPSVLWIETESERHLLASDVYDSIRWRAVDDSTGTDRRVENIARDSIGPDDELSATFRVPDAIDAGTYRAWGLVRAKWTAAIDGRRYPFVPFPFQIVMDVPGTR